MLISHVVFVGGHTALYSCALSHTFHPFVQVQSDFRFDVNNFRMHWLDTRNIYQKRPNTNEVRL